MEEGALATQATVPPATASSETSVKKKTRKSIQVKGMQKAMKWPWTETLGMTEYESKEQRCVDCSPETRIPSEYMRRRLHDEIVAYCAYIFPTIQEIHARLQVIARTAEVVRRRYPYCTLETFGSTAQNLYLPSGYVSSFPIYSIENDIDGIATDSDIDLCVTTPRTADHDAKVKMLNALSVALRKSQITKTTLVIRRARVPLVSFETTPELGKPLVLHTCPESDRCIGRLLQV